MEKIYEEKSYSQKSSKLGFSVVLSFVVAAFAIVSLIVVGFDQISYADPDTDDEEDAAVENLSVYWGYYNSSKELVLDSGGGSNTPAFVRQSTGAGSNFDIRRIFTKIDGDPMEVFCIESVKDSVDSDPYALDNETYQNDPGINYILNQSHITNPDSFIVSPYTKYPTTHPDPDKAGKQLSAADYDSLEYYATQVAIWIYQYEDEQHRYDTSKLTEEKYNAFKSSGVISTTDSIYMEPLYDSNLYTKYISQVVDHAKTAKLAPSVSIKSDPAEVKAEKLEDGKYYRAGKFYIETDGDLKEYYISLSGDIGADAYVTDLDGNKIDYLTPLSPSDEFYVVAPGNKLTEEEQSVYIQVTTVFNDYRKGNFYLVTGNATRQGIVAPSSINPKVTKGRYIYFMVTPDTSMSTAQTIYFVGLIVLLCGVGIIYANAKPVEEK